MELQKSTNIKIDTKRDRLPALMVRNVLGVVIIAMLAACASSPQQEKTAEADATKTKAAEILKTPSATPKPSKTPTKEATPTKELKPIVSGICPVEKLKEDLNAYKECVFDSRVVTPEGAKEALDYFRKLDEGKPSPFDESKLKYCKYWIWGEYKVENDAILDCEGSNVYLDEKTRPFKIEYVGYLKKSLIPYNYMLAVIRYHDQETKKDSYVLGGVFLPDFMHDSNGKLVDPNYFVDILVNKQTNPLLSMSKFVYGLDPNEESRVSRNTWKDEKIDEKIKDFMNGDFMALNGLIFELANSTGSGVR